MRNDVKIVIKGQIDNDGKVVFTFPDSFNPAAATDRDEWLRSVTDPRDARVFHCEELYAFWKNKCGNYYAIVVPNKSDSRGGMLMLTLFTGHTVSNSGKVIVQVLRELKDLLIIRKEYNNREQIDNFLSKLEGYLKQDNVPYSPKQLSTNVAYRSYPDDLELVKIFQYPDQREYDSFKRIFIVPQESVSQSLPYDFERITSPVLVKYTFSGQLPQGVTIDKYTLQQGDKLTITYSKRGYAAIIMPPIRLDGKDDTCVRFHGNEFSIVDAEQARIVFKRGIKIECLTDDGRPISQFKIGYGGRQTVYQQNAMYLFDEDKNSYKIEIFASGYETCIVTITESDLINGSKQVRLTPKKVSVNVKYINPDNKAVKGVVLVNEGSPLRSILQEMWNKQIPLNAKSYTPQPINDDSNHTPFNMWNKFKWPLIITGAVILLYSLFCWSENKPIGWPFAKEKKEVSQGPETPPIDPNLEEITTNDENQKEQEDINWMKDNNTWNKDHLKSQKYQTLLDHMAQGQIDVIIEKMPWFNDVPVNNLWKQCEELMKEMDPKIKSRASEELKRISKSNKEIDVEKLCGSLRLLLKNAQNESDKSTEHKSSEIKRGNTVTDNTKKNAPKPEGNKKSNTQEQAGRERSR